ncbi:hypothetical protein CWI37_1706p0010 [Hamiltosporidium tvaerminnensis]|uniref:WD40 domain-containing protein n=1 Tax=Hamiltosporidium tvaerminnensis TaxID=1176355 RepID=A0A4Q9KUT8_9MICR|nr:mitotic spindle checkpoint protein Bub3 [Hamiltosporidium tvaerminnensis]TBT98546.1 hypothetical protein CWI37_1706p0010 [Hamiltosporidium tvaerminnensis]
MKINDAPSDSISDIKFNKNLLVTSWDKIIRLYDINENKQIMKLTTEYPILKGIFKSDTECVIGDVKGNINFIDIERQLLTNNICVDRGIQCLYKHNSAFLCGGWSKKIYFFDDQKVFLEKNLPEKIVCSDIKDDKIIIGMNNRVSIYDIRNFNNPIKDTEYKDTIIRSISFGIKDIDYCFGTVNGKIRVEFSNQKNNFSFNSNYQPNNNFKLMYPINHIEFNEDRLIVGGSDGLISEIDVYKKKRTKTIFKGNTGISCFVINNDKIIIGCSYLYEKGNIEHLPSSIHVVNI